MKSPESSTTAAAAESSMDYNTSDQRQNSSRSTFVEEGNDIDGGDPAVWSAFTENFRQVQSVLDRNRVLIQQVNENHQSKEHANLVKNVALIQEINSNISKVVSLYSNLSTDFSTVFHHQRNGDGMNSEEKQ